ncbi:hypothetical protein AUP68_08457 [Ilyonectria robusta]
MSEVPFLIPPKPDGLKCRKCPYIAKQEKKIHKHFRTCHGWQNPRSRGRPKKGDIDLAPERPWIEHVPCQRFFLSRAASGWFEVGRKMAAYKGKSTEKAGDDQYTKSATVAPETRAHLQEVLEREQRYLDTENQPRVYSKALGDDSFAATSLWLEHRQLGSTLLIHFSGILGFSADCRQFRLARQYCPHLSGLIYVQRLIFLESALPLSCYVTIGIEQRPRIQQLERLNKVRERYMVAGSPTPLAELHSLRNFGHRVARTEPPTFFLHLSDDGDRVSWGDDFSLSMQDFRGLADYFITRAEELCDELMYGFEPHFDLSKIKDDMTNTQQGYSFVMHPDNGFESLYKDLLVRVCTSRTGKLARQGQWNFKAITSYLRLMTRLEEMLGGGYLTACGQVPRLLELLSLAVENSPCATRGMFIWNGSVAYALQHHKAKRSTNQEFYVSNGKAWTSTRLTALLKAASKKVWDRGVNSRVYRQLAIGITEKHVREVYSPFNRYDDRSTDADRNVVFAWQSGHRPMQRAVTYGLDGAYPHQLQPSLLRAYEWASTRWHEFLHQASKKGAYVDEDPPTSIQRSMRAESYKVATFISQIDVQSINGTKKRRIYTSGEKLCQAGESHSNHTPARHIYSTVRLEGFACILPEYHILVCLLCKAAVRPGGAIESYFRHVHHLKGEILKAIKQLHSGWTLEDPMNMAPLDDGSKVVTELAAQWGYSCKSCIYMTISRKNALTHCAQHKPGISKANAPAWKEVLLQTVMRGRYAQYWIVGDT